MGAIAAIGAVAISFIDRDPPPEEPLPLTEEDASQIPIARH